MVAGLFLVRQALSALCSAASEDLSAVGVSHSLAETVFLLAMKLFGLVGSQHFNTPPFL